MRPTSSGSTSDKRLRPGQRRRHGVETFEVGPLALQVGEPPGAPLGFVLELVTHQGGGRRHHRRRQDLDSQFGEVLVRTGEDGAERHRRHDGDRYEKVLEAIEHQPGQGHDPEEERLGDGAELGLGGDDGQTEDRRHVPGEGRPRSVAGGHDPVPVDQGRRHQHRPEDRGRNQEQRRFRRRFREPLEPR